MKLVTPETTLGELGEILTGVRLTLYGIGDKWSAVAWRGPYWGAGKGTTQAEAIDVALNALKTGRGRR